MKQGVDPLYGFECEISEESSDETIFFSLLINKQLSYSLHISLLEKKSLFKTIRQYNDKYHSNSKNKDFLSFCIVKTIFTNIPTKKYIYLEDLGKEFAK